MFERKPEHTLPEGCRGAAGEVYATASNNFSVYIFATEFGCIGLTDGHQRLNEAEIYTPNDLCLHRTLRRHARGSAAAIAAVCATCPLSPGVKERAEAEERAAYADTLERQIELAGIQKETEALRLRRLELEDGPNA